MAKTKRPEDRLRLYQLIRRRRLANVTVAPEHGKRPSIKSGKL